MTLPEKLQKAAVQYAAAVLRGGGADHRLAFTLAKRLRGAAGGDAVDDRSAREAIQAFWNRLDAQRRNLTISPDAGFDGFEGFLTRVLALANRVRTPVDPLQRAFEKAGLAPITVRASVSRYVTVGGSVAYWLQRDHPDQSIQLPRQRLAEGLGSADRKVGTAVVGELQRLGLIRKVAEASFANGKADDFMFVFESPEYTPPDGMPVVLSTNGDAHEPGADDVPRFDADELAELDRLDAADDGEEVPF